MPHQALHIISSPYVNSNRSYSLTGGTARWLQLQPSSAWPRRRKRSKMFPLCTTRITARSIWILDFHFKIVLVLRRRYLIPIRCNNGNRKMWPWRWLHHFDFQPWRWLHALMTMVALFRAGNFWHTHTADPLQTNILIGCIIVVKCDTCKISGAYAHLDWITSTVGDIGNRHSMQVTHSYWERIFHLFPPQLKANLWMIWHTNLNCHWVQNIVNFKEWQSGQSSVPNLRPSLL